jgi:hypothetical protein
MSNPVAPGSAHRTLANAGQAPPLGDLLGFVSELEWGSAKPGQLLKSLEERILPFASENCQAVLAEFLRGLEPYIAVAGKIVR